MTSSEIFSKCLPHTASMTPGVGGMPELTWEDVMGSISGIEKKHEGFIRYVYLDDPKGHHDFFAGLMTEIFTRTDVQRWVLNHPKKIESLVLLAIKEWKHSRQNYTDKSRALAFGESYHNWRRHYRTIYSIIVGTPTNWEDEVTQKLKWELRR